MTLGEALKKIRERKFKLTQEAFAKEFGVTRPLIAGIEGGARTSRATLEIIARKLDEDSKKLLLDTPEAQKILGRTETVSQELQEDETEDMISLLKKLRRTDDADLSGTWNAMWLTTIKGNENRNREIIHFQRRWNGSWQLTNETISQDNPDGGYLWIAKLELFDGNHLLGYYCARDRTVRAKGTLCMELQTNGREILGIWDGLNFDTMWASGLVVMTRSTSTLDPADSLDNFIRTKPKMPY